MKTGPGLTAKPQTRGTIAPYSAGGIQKYNSGGIQPYISGGVTPTPSKPVAPTSSHVITPNNARTGSGGWSVGGNYPVQRHPRRIYVGGAFRTLVPIAALGGFYYGGRHLYPHGYVTLARPMCSGVSENGCALNWQEVGLEGGGAEFQCVEFCPADVPYASVISLAAAPPVPAGACELVIHSEARFTGLSAPTRENQARLADIGWKNEISSIRVKSGVWDFFTDDDYLGDAMRLAPGEYADLGEQWTRRIGSLMCVQPMPRLAALPQTPIAGCEIVIYSEPMFAGTSAPTGESQPRLADAGWKNEIASIEVKAGAWDVYKDDEYRGEMIRLPPGKYQTLNERWAKQISSFRCQAVQ